MAETANDFYISFYIYSLFIFISSLSKLLDYCKQLMINITSYVISHKQSIILDFTLLKISLWISSVNKLCVSRPDLVQYPGKYFGEELKHTFLYINGSIMVILSNLIVMCCENVDRRWTAATTNTNRWCNVDFDVILLYKCGWLFLLDCEIHWILSVYWYYR